MPDPRVADLYGLDPGQFVAGRDALAKALRGAGDRAGAADVKKLRRPTTTAWALNQVARHHPELIQAVLDAGGGLRAATARAVAGDASGMRAAKAAERTALDGAVAAAAGYLQQEGHANGQAFSQRLSATLHAAMVDPDVAQALVAGTLDQDQDAPGLGLGFAVDVTEEPAEPDEAAGEADVAGLEDEADRLAGRATRLRADADAAEGRAARRRADAEEAERRAARLRADADQAERDAARLRADAEGAEEEAARRGAAADEAETRADEARRALTEAGGR